MGFKPTTCDKRVETLRYFSLPLTDFTPTSAILPRPSHRPLYQFVTSFIHYLPTGANLWPAILSEPRDVTVTPSSGGPPTFTILCIKSPGATVTWFRNGKLVDISRNRQDLKVSSDGSLHVTNALKGRDEGSYQCLVSNRNGAVLSRKATVKFACKYCYLLHSWSLERQGFLPKLKIQDSFCGCHLLLNVWTTNPFKLIANPMFIIDLVYIMAEILVCTHSNRHLC